MQQCGKGNKLVPRISIIMGVYNGERFLREAIESILKQTYSDFEFIICNDCSTDNSMEIIQEYLNLDKRIIVLNNEVNSGLAASLNKCLQVARGEFVARMDCDDSSLPNRFEKQLEWLHNHENVCVVGSAVEYIDDNSHVYAKQIIEEIQFFELKDVVCFSRVVHPSVMMRREHIIEVGGYTVNELTSRAEDYDLWCKLCEKGYVIANIPQILFQYREDESNIVRRKYKYRIQEARLKGYWIHKAQRPFREYFYAIKPLLIGLIPGCIYRGLHRRKISRK